MRVLIATQGYFPAKAYGGPPVSIENFCNLMHLEMEIYIVTANHEHGCTEALEGIKNGWHKVGYAKVLYLSESQKNYKTFYKIIEKINPDWIYLNSLFDAPNVLPLLEIAYVKKIKVLLAPRGELCAGALKKKYKKIPYILYLRMRGWIKNVHFQSTSQEETNAIHKYLNVEENKIHYVTNIPSIPCKDYLRNKKKSGKGRFIFLSRIHPKKNLLSAISYFEKIYGNVIFDIYGALEDKEYWSECQKEIAKLPHGVTVKYHGLVSHDKVHEIFSKYDAFLLPTLSENYGHVIFESLIVGTPVIISDQTPWNGVNKSKAGYAISLKDSNKFIKSIQSIVDMDQSEYEIISQNAKTLAIQCANLDCLRIRYVEIFEKGKF